MEEKKLTNEKTLSPIVLRVALALGWTLVVILFLITLFDDSMIVNAIGGGMIIGLLSVLSGIVGGNVGKKWKKTQRAMWTGTIVGTILGSVILGTPVFVFLVFIATFGS